VLSKNPLWAALLLNFKEYDCLVEGPLNNLQPSYMTFARPKRDPASDSRYAFTALARGDWDGRWDDRRHDRNSDYAVPGLRSGPAASSGRSRRSDHADSRFDPRYETESGYDSHHNDQRVGSSGLPIPNFAPLPSYAGGGDDTSSVGGDSAYDSQYGGSRTSFFSQLKEDRRGPALGYFVGGSGGGSYFNGAGDFKHE
jgi:hypothetical protein